MFKDAKFLLHWYRIISLPVGQYPSVGVGFLILISTVLLLDDLRVDKLAHYEMELMP